MNAALRERTVSLIELAQEGDAQANELLIEQNIPLVKSIVKRYLGRGCDYEDLFQLGCMGLYKAVKNFDPSMETQFSTYAVPLIMGEIRRFFRDDGAVKISRSLKQLASRAQQMINEFRTMKGVEPTLENVAAKLDVAMDELLLALDSMRPISSLDAPLTENGDATDMYALLGQDEDQTLSVEMNDLLQRLDERERLIVILRYYKGVTQTEVAERMGISQAQISRIEKKALYHLRAAIQE